MKTPREKYRNDPVYARLVNALYCMIEDANLTPSEVREAAVLACIMYEERRIRAYHIPIDVPAEVGKSLDKIGEWVDSQNELYRSKSTPSKSDQPE